MIKDNDCRRVNQLHYSLGNASMVTIKKILVSVLFSSLLISACDEETSLPKNEDTSLPKDALQKTQTQPSEVVTSLPEGSVETVSLGENGWRTVISLNKYDVLTGSESLLSGDIILAGQSGAFRAGTKNGWIVKINQFGKVEWSYNPKKVGDQFYSDVSIIDKNLIAVGTTKPSSRKAANGNVIHFNPEGKIIREKSFFPPQLEDSREIIASNSTEDGNFFLLGNNNISPTFQSHGKLIKITPEGETLWVKNINEQEQTHLRGMAATNDGGVLVTGETGSDYPEIPFVTKLDSNGDRQMSFVLEQNINSSVQGKVQTIEYSPTGILSIDSDIILYGHRSEHGSGKPTQGWIQRHSADGTLIWSNHFGDEEYHLLWDAIYDSDSKRIVLSGKIQKIREDQIPRRLDQPWLLSIDFKDGKILSEKVLKRDKSESLLNVEIWDGKAIYLIGKLPSESSNVETEGVWVEKHSLKKLLPN